VVDEDRSIIRISGPLYEHHETSIRRVYIIVHEPGCIPEKKHPIQTDEGITRFLLALEMCRPKGTFCTVVKLVWNGDIWVQHGSEWLSEERLLAPRKFAKLRRKVEADMKLIAPKKKRQTKQASTHIETN
jgi:hypothetical protein